MTTNDATAAIVQAINANSLATRERIAKDFAATIIILSTVILFAGWMWR
jgi:hypothetical protein